MLKIPALLQQNFNLEMLYIAEFVHYHPSSIVSMVVQ